MTIIGVPKEIKNHEYRVGLTPDSVAEIVHHGHTVIVEDGLGAPIGFPNQSYIEAGASIVSDAAEIFAKAEMIIKVKEPQPHECKMLRSGQLLFTYLHLAPDRLQTELLLESKCTAIAYETVTDDHGHLPLLRPMSEVAGRLAIQAGAHCLEKAQGGRGVLLGGVPGVAPAKVVVLGGGVVGFHSICMAVGVEAQVTVLDKSLERLRELSAHFGSKLNCIYSTKEAVQKYVLEADLVIGAVLVPGAAAPRLVTKEMVHKMKKGAVMVDVAIDQGGCFETSRPTTHQEPTYVVDGVVHYCVANMPSAVARTSAVALNNATLPFALQLAGKGYRRAIAENKHLANGLNVHNGMLTFQPVADALDMSGTSVEEALRN